MTTAPRPSGAQARNAGVPSAAGVAVDRAGRFDSGALYAALDAERRVRGMSWAQVARETGVSASTLSRTAQDGPMELDGIRAMVRWLGRTAAAQARVSLRAQQSDLTAESAAALDYVVRISFRPGRFDAQALYSALDAQRQERGLSWRQVASEVGLPAAMLTHTARGGRIAVNTMLAMVSWLGFPDRADRFTYLPGPDRSGRSAADSAPHRE